MVLGLELRNPVSCVIILIGLVRWYKLYHLVAYPTNIRIISQNTPLSTSYTPFSPLRFVVIKNSQYYNYLENHMKFKKVLVTGLSEPEMETGYWLRIKNITGKIDFSSATDDDLISLLSDADCLFVKFNGVTKKMIDNAPNLKYIGVFGTGFGKVDAEYAKNKGITICNVPGYSTQSVSEFVFAVILEHIRDIERAKEQAREGNYSEAGFSASEIKDKTFGVVGLGQIGLRTAEIAVGFGAKVKYWSRSEKYCSEKIDYADADEVISSSDILSLHLVLNSGTKTFLNSKRINNIKQGAIVVNTSSMELLDLDALENRLKKSDITFILDHSDEMTEKDLNRFSKYDNCIIYPPIGYISAEAGIAKQEIFVSNIENFIKGNPINCVN